MWGVCRGSEAAEGIWGCMGSAGNREWLGGALGVYEGSRRALWGWEMFCASCLGSRKEFGGDPWVLGGRGGVFNCPGVCGMFWEAQERAGGFVGTRDGHCGLGGVAGRVGQGNPQTRVGRLTWPLHLHGQRGAGGFWCPPAPEGAVGGHGGRQKQPPNPSGPAAFHWPSRPPVLALSQSAPEDAALGAVPRFRASLLTSRTTSPEMPRGAVTRL